MKTDAQLTAIPSWVVAPDGRRIEDVPALELRRQILALGVEDIAADLGHADLVAAYVKHMNGVYDRAGRQSVIGYLGAMGVLA